MKRYVAALFCVFACSGVLLAQTNGSGAAVPASASDQDAALRLDARAVLVDVIVTDNSGKPIDGLPKDAFSIAEDGKTQAVTYFEEHTGKAAVQSAQMPQLPPNVFSNFSPFPQPDVVNVLLLDSLDTTMESQGWVHKQALKFLKSAKPGQRMAIFTMDLGLHFIQGFNDDPTVLAAALEDKKNNAVQESVALKSRDQTVAEQTLGGMMSEAAPGGGTSASAEAIASMQSFLAENDVARESDRMFVALENLQKLAAFLAGFPGRKNIIWFAEKPPSIFLNGSGQSNNPAIGDEIRKTMAMLAAARAAIYPVDPGGTKSNMIYSAGTNLPKGLSQGQAMIGNGGYLTATAATDDSVRDSDQIAAQIVAEQSGGHAYANINSLAELIAKISDESNHFYTLSYRPANERMDGVYRKIDVKVAGGHYRLAYRRGYFAVEDALPGSSMETVRKEVAELAAKNPGAVDPLVAFMALGMPETEQILYKIRVNPAEAPPNTPEKDKDKTRYKVDFALDTTDIALPADADGSHKGVLNVSLIVYDRYANMISREDHLVQLNFKPGQYEAVKQTGVQLHALLAVPKGNYWLRTGIYDRGSHKVGTMEIPLAAVKPAETAVK